MDFNGQSILHSLPDGSTLAPAQYFRGEPTSGLFRDVISPSSTELVFTKNGNKRLRITDTGVAVDGTLDADSIGPIDEFTLNDGTEVDPPLAFSAALHTGIYRDTFNAPVGIGFTVGSTQRL